MYGAGEKNRAVRSGPRLRGRATSISRVIPGAVGRAPKISNARVIEEPPQVECIKVFLLEDTTTTIATSPLPLPLSLFSSSTSSPFLTRFLVLSRRPCRSSFFSIVRDNDTHTLSLGNNINGLRVPGDHRGPGKRNIAEMPLTRWCSS